MKHQIDLLKAVKTLQDAISGGSYQLPLVDQMIAEFGHDPFIILISCLLSLRARDIVTIHVCRELFQIIKTPEDIISCDTTQLEKFIYKTGYYKTKARVLQDVSQVLIEKYQSTVPDTEEELLALPGVGQKTANLVLGLAFNKPAICVDTHVHRISNLFGLVQTKNADETEKALKQVLPKSLWIEWNRLLVIWGQNICTPPTPKCSICPLQEICPQIGLKKSR